MVKSFHSRKCTWKFCLGNGSHFVSACWIIWMKLCIYTIPPHWHGTGTWRTAYWETRTCWCHAMERISTLQALMRGIHQSPVDSPHIGAVMLSFDVFFDANLNKMLNKQSIYQWFETPTMALMWCNILAMSCSQNHVSTLGARASSVSALAWWSLIARFMGPTWGQLYTYRPPATPM